MKLFYDLGEAIESVRKKFMDRIKNGSEEDCPCCGRYTKVYHRQIYSSMAVQLIQLYRLGGDKEFVHVRRLLIKGTTGVGDFSKFAYWKLIEGMPKDDIKKHTSGYWMLTDIGVEFVKGVIGVQRYAIVYDSNVIGFSGSMRRITDCLDEAFDYEELMGA